MADPDSPTPVVALVGQPNCGKTTLFNTLTGQRQKVGNYPGVTVEKKLGEIFTSHGRKMQLVDLPGAYSLCPDSPDEAVTRDVLLGEVKGLPVPDLVLCVVDASNLERHLVLALEVIDLNLPTLVVLNRVDLAEAAGIRFDVTVLSEMLGAPVVVCQGNDRQKVIELKQAISKPLPIASGRKWKAEEASEKALARLTNEFESAKVPVPQGHAMLLLADPEFRLKPGRLPDELREKAVSVVEDLHADATQLSLSIQQSRQRQSQEISRLAMAREGGDTAWKRTDKLDAILVHPFYGWIVFAGLMLTMFSSLFIAAAPLMDGVEWTFGQLKEGVEGAMPEGDLRDLIASGIIDGVGGVIIFLPQILLLFLFIGIMESSGYMARAAFLMDGVMRRFGLSGKSFIPLLSSYACAIPGIMATRTIDNAKDRLVTILIAPWMSCNARLPVYTLLIAVIFGSDSSGWVKGLALFGLYAMGTLAAMVVAWLLRKSVAKSESSPLLLELPTYRVPDMGFIGRQLFDRGWAFVKRAGTLILGFSIILWFLQAYPKSEEPDRQLSESYLGQAGQSIEPAMKPLGYDWRIGVSVLTSFAAREVFATGVAILFIGDEDAVDDQDRMVDAVSAATWPDGRKLFDLATNLSLLVFYVFALQCLPTVVATKRETNSWKWAGFQFGYMTVFAYLAALITYQGVSFFV